MLALGAAVTSAAVACASPTGAPDVAALATAVASADLETVPASRFCVTAGAVDALDARTLDVDVGGMRGVVAGGAGRSAEVSFVYPGPSASTAPLADGELRRQIGLKLRAQDTCNVVYVMWHIEPTPGIFVLVKSNPTMSQHAQCGDSGYTLVRAAKTAEAAIIEPNAPHTLRADLEGETLRVHADGNPVWEGTLPAEALAFDGPAGVRTDNGHFAFELRVPHESGAALSCSQVQRGAAE